MNDGNNGGALAITTQGFGSLQHQRTGIESAATAVAAQSKAMVEARYIMAMQRPRDWDQVRIGLLRECRRPSFAFNKSAFYRKPIGAGVEGLGIRFVEVALRCMTNVLVETTMIFEDDIKEVHRVSVTDLESNLTYPLDVRVSKTVERSKPMDDGSYISVRKNSYGKESFTVPANDDDLLNKRGALISKAMRTIGLRIIPGDLQDEAEAIIKQIRQDEAARDPDAERKKIADAFAEINVRPSDIAAYLGHDLGSCSPAELVNLRGFYGAIRDGEATWKSIMDAKVDASKAEDGSGTGAPPPAPVARPQRKKKDETAADEKKVIPASSDAATAAPAAAAAPELAVEPSPAAASSSHGALATDGEKQYIAKKCSDAGVTVESLCEDVGIKNFEALTPDGFIALRERLAEITKG